MGEIHTIQTINRLLRDHKLNDDMHREMFLHLIPATEALGDLHASSKLNGDWDFLLHLKELGRNTAQEWVKNHAGDLGKRSTLSICDDA
jgi:NTE family protein